MVVAKEKHSLFMQRIQHLKLKQDTAIGWNVAKLIHCISSEYKTHPLATVSKNS